MNVRVLAGSPRLLRNLNEKAVLERLLGEGPLTRMELEAFTGLSKPAMSELLRRLETSQLIRRDGQKAGTYGPKAGLWALEPSSSYVAGVSVTSHALDIAIADISGRIVTTLAEQRSASSRDPVGPVLLELLRHASGNVGLPITRLDQVVVGLPGIVDTETGHLRKGRQVPDWEGFDISAALRDALGHRHVLIENDVNLVTIEEGARGAAKGVNSVILFWIGEGVGGGLMLDGRLVRGSTGSAGELGGALVPDRPVDLVRPATVEELLSPDAIAELLRANGLPGEDVAAEIQVAAHDLRRQGKVIDDLAYRVSAALAGAIGILDPEMVVLAGDIGVAGGRALAQRVIATLSALPIAIPQIVPSAVGDYAVRAGAIELALEHTRERVFTGGSAARGLP